MLTVIRWVLCPRVQATPMNELLKLPSSFHRSVYCRHSLVCSSCQPRIALLKRIARFRLLTWKRVKLSLIIQLTYISSTLYQPPRLGPQELCLCIACSDFHGFFLGHPLYQLCTSRYPVPFLKMRNENTLDTSRLSERTSADAIYTMRSACLGNN